MAFNPYKEFETDKEAEAEGVWVDLGDGAKVLVARFSNPAHEKAIRRLQKPYRSILNSGRQLPKDVADDITVKSLVEAVLLGWEGMTDRDGAVLPYTPANADKLLRDLPDFRNVVATLAMSAETFRLEALRDAEGNSPTSSDGKSSGAAKKASG